MPSISSGTRTDTPTHAATPGFAAAWVRATWLGWLAGIPLIIALALAGEAVGIAGAQFLVGAGIGWGVGFMQQRTMRRALGVPVAWLLSCVVGLTAPFLLTDIATAAGWTTWFSLYWAVAAGGFITGVWQALLLRPHLRHAGWWVPVSTAGWTLAAGTAAIADALPGRVRGLPGAALYLGIVLVGGAILGLVTAPPLARMLRERLRE